MSWERSARWAEEVTSARRTTLLVRRPAGRRDHLLDSGHFALESHLDLITGHMRDSLARVHPGWYRKLRLAAGGGNPEAASAIAGATTPIS